MTTSKKAWRVPLGFLAVLAGLFLVRFRDRIDEEYRLVLLAVLASVFVAEAWRRYRMYDRSTLRLSRKVCALAGLWAATANVAAGFAVAILAWSPPVPTRLVGQVVGFGALLSGPAMILVAAGGGKSGWFALPSFLILVPLWVLLGFGV